MTELKTRVNDGSVYNFLESVDNPQRKADSLRVLKLMQELTGEEPKMWGGSIVGFGSYHYKNKSGREGDWFLTGFSPRKQSMTLYIMSGFSQYDELMAKLGKHKTGKSCLYVNKMDDIDESVLKELITASVDFLKDRY